ncbi:toxin-antitoxin system, antitoxin component, Xre family protein [Fusobacterium polymorphum]|uniref:Toxin-antitoxin system, antitoxin component, Xre family protein n=1 Tax=Fusobacterium nucleatum subsp. polymorphum TaxID=76857 RepID=A0A2B7YA91_FUSNP|nr:helix-turn-helix transcriptional regulator [Fusobacterium polymorphum]PGH20984.1 toxin-antitoxin system, antitoxin component, Xre family protein [Fusobacterium polymorphum]
MINQKLLHSKVALAGLTFKELAQKIGMPYQSLNNRKVGKIEFNSSEIKALKDVLNLTNDDVAEIFFN